MSAAPKKNYNNEIEELSDTVPMLELNTENATDDTQSNSNGQSHETSTTNPMRKQNASGYKRLVQEIQQLLLRPPNGIAACPVEQSDLMAWFAIVYGPPRTPYAVRININNHNYLLNPKPNCTQKGGTFYLHLTFSSRYPFEPPKVVFKTRIYHCNVNTDNGDICLDILNDKYSPVLTVEKILLSVSALLSNANPEDPLVPEIATQLLKDKEAHDARAKEWTERYAIAEDV
eukprot:74247_1